MPRGRPGSNPGRIQPCGYCGTPYFVGGHLIGKSTYCSQNCMGLAYRGTAEDFWAKVDRLGPDECWLWKASTYRKTKRQMGYGRHAGSGPYTYAHRAAWLYTHGEIPAGKVVMHKCDVILCCNPAHLRLGTHAENMADMAAKGRARNKEMARQERLLDIRHSEKL